MSDDPQLRIVDTLILVDEAHHIMSREIDALHKLLIEGRGFGVGVLLASQYLSHFQTRVNWAQPLETWFVHKVPRLSQSELRQIGLPNANAEMVEEIKVLEKYQCLCKTLDVEGRIIRGKPFWQRLLE